MNIHKPTQLVFVSFVFLSITLIVHRHLNANDRLAILAILTIAMLPSLYSINCLVGGDCVIWAWYNSIILTFWCISAALVSIKKNKKKTKT
jgi:hypothetical protein